jgi:hypothetical protein
LAILAIVAFVTINRALDGPMPKRSWLLGLTGLFLSACTLVRGEFLFIFLIVLFLMLLLRGGHSIKSIGLITLLLLSLPLVYGLINLYLFGDFIPLRLQSGQNLFEPIGQFANPYGIKYSDEWLDRYLRARGLTYASPAADEYLTRQYLILLSENPLLFLRNLLTRLELFSEYFRLPLAGWSLIALTTSMGLMVRRERTSLYPVIPWLLALAYILFFAWTNSLLRLISPAHFLINATLTFWLTYLLHESRLDIPQLERRLNHQPSTPGD